MLSLLFAGLRRKNLKRRQSGSVSIIVIFAFAALFSAIGLAVTGGEISARRQQLQDIADAAALAGAAALRDGADSAQAIANAASVTSQGQYGALYRIDLREDAVTVGRYDFVNEAFNSPLVGTEGIPAVRVALPMSIVLESPDGEVSTSALGKFLERSLGSLELNAEAIAVVRPRDLVIVQDITGSFQEEFEFAREADLALVKIIAESYGGLGDSIGVVTFGRRAQTEFPLTPVDEGIDDLNFFLASTMEVCTSTSSRHRFENRTDHRRYDPTDPSDDTGRRLRRVNCAGTGTGEAIEHAATMLKHAVARGADPVVVLVTDGVPCHYRSRRSPAQWVEDGKQVAIESAIAAKEEGIRIFVVNMSTPPFGSGCLADGSDFNIDLASHGYGTTTDDPEELKRKLTEVANKLTLRLVR